MLLPQTGSSSRLATLSPPSSLPRFSLRENNPVVDWASAQAWGQALSMCHLEFPEYFGLVRIISVSETNVSARKGGDGRAGWSPGVSLCSTLGPQGS